MTPRLALSPGRGTTCNLCGPTAAEVQTGGGSLGHTKYIFRFSSKFCENLGRVGGLYFLFFRLL